jgi:hypothetical protein
MAQLQSLKSFLMANFPESPDLLEIARLEIELEEVDRRDFKRCFFIIRGNLFKRWDRYHDNGVTSFCGDCYSLANFSEEDRDAFWFEDSDISSWQNWRNNYPEDKFDDGCVI